MSVDKCCICDQVVPVYGYTIFVGKCKLVGEGSQEMGVFASQVGVMPTETIQCEPCIMHIREILNEQPLTLAQLRQVCRVRDARII